MIKLSAVLYAFIIIATVIVVYFWGYEEGLDAGQAEIYTNCIIIDKTGHTATFAVYNYRLSNEEIKIIYRNMLDVYTDMNTTPATATH